MVSSFVREAALRRAGVLVACLTLICGIPLMGAGKSPMRVLKYDPAAEKMDLFAAIDSKALSVRVVAHDSEGGNVFIENLSGKPLTVNLPEAVAMVQVLKQNLFQAGGNGQSNNNNGFSNLFGNQQGGQSGGAQNLGGGFGQQGANGNNGQVVGNNQNPFVGNGFFSIPPDRVAQVAFRSVCLNYGKPDPSPRMTYKVVPLESYTDDKVLQESLRMFGRGEVDRTVAQAAAWHRTDKLSWQDLSNIKRYTLPGVYTSQVPIFSMPQLKAAHELIEKATKQAESNPTPPVNTVSAQRKI